MKIRRRTWHGNTLENEEGALFAEAAGPGEVEVILASVNGQKKSRSLVAHVAELGVQRDMFVTAVRATLFQLTQGKVLDRDDCVRQLRAAMRRAGGFD